MGRCAAWRVEVDDENISQDYSHAVLLITLVTDACCGVRWPNPWTFVRSRRRCRVAAAGMCLCMLLRSIPSLEMYKFGECARVAKS